MDQDFDISESKPLTMNFKMFYVVHLWTIQSHNLIRIQFFLRVEDFDQLTEEIMTHEAIIQGVIKPTSPNDCYSHEDDVDKSNNITWNPAADALKRCGNYKTTYYSK